MINLNGKYTNATIMNDRVEADTISQIVGMINNKSFQNNVVIMPDVHEGKGAVIGFTMSLGNQIVPNVVGVDIACQMLAYRVERDALNDIDMDSFDRDLRSRIPMGKTVKDQPLNIKSGNWYEDYNFNWSAIQKACSSFVNAYNKRFGVSFSIPDMNYTWFEALCKKVGVDKTYAEASIGTLGGGNHFIEVGIDEEEYLWVTVHSGSRNLGSRTAIYWQNRACDNVKAKDRSKVINNIKDNYPKSEWQTRISELKNDGQTKGLECLEGKDMFEYLVDSLFLYYYAGVSVRCMMGETLMLLNYPDFITSVHTVHNYVSHHDFIIRKGAVASYKDYQIIVPFNMEDGLVICEGKSNPDWNFSAPHGAGRVMGRAEAKKSLKAEMVLDIQKRMLSKGILSKSLPVDELKEAYKDPTEILSYSHPTMEVIHTVKPIIGFKE